MQWEAVWVLIGFLVVLAIFVASGWANQDELANRMLERLLRRVEWEDSHERS